MMSPATLDSVGRLRAIDTARGAAMVLACLQHFAWVHFHRTDPDSRLAAWITEATYLASPMFMVISGMMLGLMYGQNRGGFARTRLRLFDRGLFLLTIGHVAIVLSHAPHSSGGDLVRRGFITDVIGICVLVNPLLVAYLGGRARVALSALLAAGGWGLLMAWQPGGTAGQLLLETVSGPMSERLLVYNVPLLPWLAVHLASTTLGEHLAGSPDAASQRRLTARMMRLGAIGIAGGLLLKASYRGAEAIGWLTDPALRERLYVLTSPSSRLPPSPAYLLFFGGAALVATGLILLATQRGWMGRLVEWLAPLGQASLFVFVLQFYLYYVVVYYLAPWLAAPWPLTFLVTVLVLVQSARLWTRHALNRYLTVGLPAAASNLPRRLRPLRQPVGSVSIG